MLQHFHNISFRSRLVLITGGLVVLIVSCLIYLITSYAGESLKTQLQSNLNITLIGESRNLKERIELFQEETATWTQEPIISIFFEKPNFSAMYRPGLDSFLQYRLSNIPWVFNVLLLDNSGLLYQYKDMFRGKAAEERFPDELIEYFNKAPDIFSLNLHKYDSYLTQPFLFLKSSYQKQNSQQNNKSLITIIDLTVFHQMYYKKDVLSDNNYFTFVTVSDDGQVLIPLPDITDSTTNNFKEILRSWTPNLSDYTSTLTSESIIAINKKIPGMPLYSFGISSVDKIQEPINNLVEAVLLIGSAILLLGIGAVYFLSRRMMDPFLKLTKAMQEYSTDSGNSAKALGNIQQVLKRKDELGILANTFSDMGQRINQEIEERLNIEHYFQNITDQTFDAIAVIDDKGNILTWNHACEKIFGYSYSEVIGKSLHSLLLPQELQVQQRKGFANFVRTGKGPLIGSVVEVEAIHKGGYRIPVEVSINVIKNHDKWNALGIIRDLTEKKRLEKEKKEKEIAYIEQAQRALIREEFLQNITKQKENFETIFLHLNYGIAILDKDAHFIDFNDFFLDMFGCERQKLLQKSWLDLTFSDDVEKVNVLMKKVFTNESVQEMEQLCLTCDDRIVHIDITIALLPDKQRLLVSAKDNTQKHYYEQMLQEEKDKYQTLMDQSSEAIFIMSMNDGKLVHYNRMVKKLLRYNDEELKNLTVFDWDKDIKDEADYREINKNICYEPIVLERIHTRKDGTTYVASCNLVQVNINGREYIYGSVRDITKQKNTEKQLYDRIKQQEALLNIETTGLMRAKDRKFIWVNNAFDQLLGYTKEELIGEDTRIIYADDDAYEDYGKGYKELREKGVFTRELRCAKKDGTPVTLLGCMTTIDADTSEIIGVMTDITPMKNALVELEEAKQKADQANEAKSVFLANMSHEIRTPLNGIIGLTDIVLNTHLDELQQDYLNKVKQSSSALLHIINDILDYSKIEAGKLDIVKSKFSLENTLQNISDLFEHQISQKGLDFIFTVDPDCPTHLIGDSLRVNQVLINLIGNAVKFTEKGFIQLDVKPTDIYDHQVTIQFCIKDSGIGISEEKQKQLFMPFEQGDKTTTKKYGGSGLGLMISKQLVEIMGGGIFLESKEGMGATFCFTIPFTYIEQDTHCDLSELQTHRFLIVDDSSVKRSYLREVLTSWGITTDTASDTRNALEKLKNISYDTLIIDWSISDNNGLELLEELKKKDIYTNNILMVTAYDKQEVQEEINLKGLSISNLLTKPYTPSMLCNILVDKKITTPDNKNQTPKQWVLESPKKLLVAEDNETNQLVASIIFNKMGFEVDIADNGLEAVEKAHQEDYDIIFMDLQMPVMDGFEASKTIRTFNPDVPIVALSAAVMQKDQTLTKEAGMQHHIGKPMDKTELLEIIKQYFPLTCLDA